MFIKVLVSSAAILGILFWLVRRQRSYNPALTEQVSEEIKDHGESKDILDDTQAAEIVATWNILNPPSS